MTSHEHALELFQRVRDEMVFLKAAAQLYKRLFLADESDAELLNRVRDMLTVMGQALADVLIMGISRLTDKGAAANSANLSLQRLAKAFEEDGDGELSIVIHQALQSTQPLVADLRRHRNKRLAHLDLQQALCPATQLLPEITFNHLWDCLRRWHDALNMCQHRIENATTAWEVDLFKGADALLSHLRRSAWLAELTMEFEKAHFEKRPPVEVSYNVITAKLEWK